MPMNCRASIRQSGSKGFWSKKAPPGQHWAGFFIS
jgi:hypothetical protein